MQTASGMAPIGIFDSGIGGLSVLQALREALPHEPCIYVADSGHAPYGERGDAFVQQRCAAITDYLLKHHAIKLLVVACNTATAATCVPFGPNCPWSGWSRPSNPPHCKPAPATSALSPRAARWAAAVFKTCCTPMASKCIGTCKPAMAWPKPLKPAPGRPTEICQK